MTLQLDKKRVYFSIVFILHFFFFFNNYFLLFNGKTVKGVVSHYEKTGRNGKYTRAIINFEYEKYRIEFRGNINVNYSSPNVTVIFDPNDFSNVYEYSFFGFYFERLLFLFVLSVAFLLPILMFKIAKNSYLLIDIKKLSFKIGKNIWDEEEVSEINQFINQINGETYLTASETIYLKNPNLCSSEVLAQIIIQELCLKEFIRIRHEWISLNRNDKKTHLRTFFQVNSSIDYTKLSSSYKAVLKIFKPKSTLRNHEIYQRLKYLYGLEIEMLVTTYLINDLKVKEFIDDNNNQFDEVKEHVEFIVDITKFIDDNISALIEKTPEKLSKLIQFLQTNILLLSKETLFELRKFSKKLDEKIPSNLFNQLPYYFQNQNIFIPVSLLVDSINFETNYTLILFDGGDFGGGGAGDSW